MESKDLKSTIQHSSLRKSLLLSWNHYFTWASFFFFLNSSLYLFSLYENLQSDPQMVGYISLYFELEFCPCNLQWQVSGWWDMNRDLNVSSWFFFFFTSAITWSKMSFPGRETCRTDANSQISDVQCIAMTSWHRAILVYS